MIARLIPALALAASGSWANAADAPRPPASVTVELPSGGDTFPGGKEAAAINSNCLTCHSSEMVLMQPKLSKTTWGEEVTKMRKVYGAPVAEDDVPSIVDYLANLRPPR